MIENFHVLTKDSLWGGQRKKKTKGGVKLGGKGWGEKGDRGGQTSGKEGPVPTKERNLGFKYQQENLGAEIKHGMGSRPQFWGRWTRGTTGRYKKGKRVRGPPGGRQLE